MRWLQLLKNKKNYLIINLKLYLRAPLDANQLTLYLPGDPGARKWTKMTRKMTRKPENLYPGKKGLYLLKIGKSADKVQWPGNDLHGLRRSKGSTQNPRKNKISAQGGAEEIRGTRGHVQKSFFAPPGRSEVRKACRDRRFQPHPWHPGLPGKQATASCIP